MKCVICIQKYGDFDMLFTDSIFIGDVKLPKLKEGLLKEDVIRTLKEYGYKKLKYKNLVFSDDFFCNSESEKERNDTRLRLVNEYTRR